MITLTIILIIWFIISLYRIYKITGGFNPYEGKIIDYAGIIVGVATLVILLIHLITTYLP